MASAHLPPPPSPSQMNLLDRAIKLAAEQDEPTEMNFVRKHAMAQAAELGTSLREAATRVFSNASGARASPPLFPTGTSPPLSHGDKPPFPRPPQPHPPTPAPQAPTPPM